MPITTPEQLAHAKLTRSHIQEHPEQHDQVYFIRQAPGCDTIACIAGWASLLAGAQPLCGCWSSTCFPTVVLVNGYKIPVADHAQSLLGLADEEVDRMFYVENEDALERLDQYIADGETRLKARES